MFFYEFRHSNQQEPNLGAPLIDNVLKVFVVVAEKKVRNELQFFAFCRIFCTFAGDLKKRDLPIVAL